MCFYKIVYGYPTISNFGYRVPEITERTALIMSTINETKLSIINTLG